MAQIPSTFCEHAPSIWHWVAENTGSNGVTISISEVSTGYRTLHKRKRFEKLSVCGEPGSSVISDMTGSCSEWTNSKRVYCKHLFENVNVVQLLKMLLSQLLSAWMNPIKWIVHRWNVKDVFYKVVQTKAAQNISLHQCTTYTQDFSVA